MFSIQFKFERKELNIFLKVSRLYEISIEFALNEEI